MANAVPKAPVDAHRLDLINELPAEDAVAIAQQISRCTLPRKRFTHLVSRPLRRRMLRDREMDDSPPFMCQHQKHVQDLEPDRRYGKEVDRHNAVDVIREERFPRLGWRSAAAHHVFAHTRFAKSNAGFQ